MNELSSSLSTGQPQIPKGQVFTSITQCSAATGYPKGIIKTAKKLGAPGFTGSSRIVWDQLEPWLLTHKHLVEGETDDTLEFYKKEIAKRDVTLRDLNIAKMKGEMIDPKDVQKFLQELATVLSSVLKQKQRELVSKATGYEKLIDEEFNTIYTLIRENVSSWNVK